jgi:predicted ATP-dependent endonuclease of OLD family
MRLEALRIKGFRNLREGISFESLDHLNVISGENNIGKSNVLAALELSFLLLGDVAMHQWPDRQIEKMLGLKPEDIYPIENLDGTAEFQLQIAFDHEEIEAIEASTGLDYFREHSSVELEIILHRSAGIYRWATAVRPSFGRTADNQIAKIATYGVHGAKLERRAFSILPSHRPSLGQEHSTELVSQKILLPLLECKESRERVKHARWLRFCDSVHAMRDALGKGELVPRLDQNTGKVSLAFETATGRIPVQRLGNGAQRVIAMLAFLSTSPTHMMALEDPEIGLHHSMQIRLRDAFRRLVADHDQPRQLLITSHSPVFIASIHGYAMRQGPEGPRAERSFVPQVSQ